MELESFAKVAPCRLVISKTVELRRPVRKAICIANAVIRMESSPTDMTIEQMKNIMVTQLRKLNQSDNIIQQSLTNLPHLKRGLLPVQEHLW